MDQTNFTGDPRQIPYPISVTIQAVEACSLIRLQMSQTCLVDLQRMRPYLHDNSLLDQSDRMSIYWTNSNKSSRSSRLSTIADQSSMI